MKVGVKGMGEPCGKGESWEDVPSAKSDEAISVSVERGGVEVVKELFFIGSDTGIVIIGTEEDGVEVDL